MSYRNGNYAAFYVAEPFSESNLNANTAKDFCYYRLLQAWKAADNSFPFVDSHNKNYNVRDDSSWNLTLKPRLHERLRNSKNIILFLSSNTKRSIALNEEIEYGMVYSKLPVIVIYPEYKLKDDIFDYAKGEYKQKIRNLWDKLPKFRDNMDLVPTLHIPMDKELIIAALEERGFMVQSKFKADIYHFR